MAVIIDFPMVFTLLALGMVSPKLSLVVGTVAFLWYTVRNILEAWGDDNDSGDVEQEGGEARGDKGSRGDS